MSYLDREQLARGRAVRVAADAPNAVAQVSCGQVARSQWAVIVDPDTDDGTPPTARSARSGCTATTSAGDTGDGPTKPGGRSAPGCASRLRRGSHADGVAVDGYWLRTGDLGVYLDGEFYVTGRRRGPRAHRRPQPLSAGHRGHRGGRLADRAAGIRRGVHARDRRRRRGLVIVAERAAGTAAPIRSRRSTRSGRRCRRRTGSRCPTSASCPPVPSRAPPAASWPVGRAARATSAANDLC